MKEKTFSGADISGATAKSQGAPQFCRHRGHYEYTAKRLVYKGLGSTDYAYFTVYSHHRKYTLARNDVFCIKSYGGMWETLGSLEENDLVLVRPRGELK